LQQSEWAAQICAGVEPGPLLELCAGAGHIGLAAAVLADRDLVQVEADPIAASYARSNAAQVGWSGRVEVRTAALERAMQTDERFAVIIADPPYLRTADTGRWPEDPLVAIDGGVDGLDVVRACLHLAAQHLIAPGHLLLQTAGLAQNERITTLLDADRGWRLACRDVRVIDEHRAIMLIGWLATREP
jgi:release factor glutamine methyltransferase